MNFKSPILCCIALASHATAAVLVDINADGTNRNATLANFEDAAGVSSGTFGGSSITYFPNSDPGGGAYSQTVDNITISIDDITNDADGWFGTGSNNNLLEDGLYHRDTTGDPTATVTLSGSGLGLLANTTYELYLFAGRSQGHLTSFTFDVINPADPTGGSTIAAGIPVVGGNETLGTVMYTFTTGGVAPTQLVFDWDGQQHVNGNQDAVFSGFALNTIPEPSSALLSMIGLAGLITLRHRNS